MRIETLIDVCCAAHLTRLVSSEFKSRGCFAIVGPPGGLKTSILGTLEEYPDASVMADINNQTMGNLRGELGRSINTMVMMDFQKLYERHAATASNMEGTIRSIIDEGWAQPSYNDSRTQGSKARCLVMGAFTPDLVNRKMTEWNASGFLRRTLFSYYELDDPHLLMDSVVTGSLVEFDTTIIPMPAGRLIHDTTTPVERRELQKYMKYHYAGPAATVPFQLLCKICAVLKWHYARLKKGKDYHMHIMHDFGPSLTREGCRLTLGSRETGSRRKRK